MTGPFESSYGGDGSKIADDTRLECGICWWVYDPALGDEETQTPPGTPFRLLPDTWECPNCAASKSKFMVIDSATLSKDDAGTNLANASRRAALKVHQALKETGPITVPREFVFRDRAAVGLGAVFLHLGAELNYHRMFNEALGVFRLDALANSQQAALQKGGLA